jgi:predicted site-specific integrase-resolvase
MAKASKPYDLVGTAEAAEILDVERSRIGRWKKAGVMPKPVIELKATPVWRRSDIVKMIDEREHRRRGKTEDDAGKPEPVLV